MLIDKTASKTTFSFFTLVYLISKAYELETSVVSRGVATVRHFRHVPTHNFFPKIFLLMKNDKQRITYFNVNICNEYCDLS